MLEPAALAETVTPPIFSPAAEVTVPLSSASAADAAEHMPGAIALDASMMASRREAVRLRAFAMGSLLILIIVLIVVVGRALRGGRGGHGGGKRHDRQIGRDGGDLAGVVGGFEARHARRA